MSDPIIDLNSPEPTAVVAAQAQPRRSWLERIVLTSGIIGITIALLAAGVLNWGLSKWENIEQVAIASIQAPEEGQPANWLLVGSDSREGIDPDDPRSGIFLGEETPVGKRTDTIIIARVDPEAGTINLLSVPRDLWVPIAGTDSSGRVNTAFNGEGGEERLVNTIEEYFGLEINHYAEINFVGFQDVVDAMGGVPIWFSSPMRDAGSGLDVSNAGCHILDGFEALAFARSRKLEVFKDREWHSDPTGDLGRTSRQQYFIRQIAATATRKLDFTSLGTVNKMIDSGGENLAISGVDPGDLIELAKIFASVEGDQIVGYSLPVVDMRTSAGAAVLELIQDQAQATLNLFRGENAVAIPESTTTTTELVFSVKVLNGSQVAGQAGIATDGLKAAGFDMAAADNADPIDKTTVLYGPGLEAAAIDVARWLGVNPVLEFDDSQTEVVVVTGKDFTIVLATPRSEASVYVPTTTAPPVTEAPVAEAAQPQVTVGIVPEATPEGTLCE